jgi:hypothetical protein
VREGGGRDHRQRAVAAGHSQRVGAALDGFANQPSRLCSGVTTTASIPCSRACSARAARVARPLPDAD